MPSDTKHPVGMALRWLAIGVVFLASAESFARLEDALQWHAPLTGPYSESRLTMRDSLGVRGRPGYRYDKWSMNAEGFRGPDVPRVPAAGTVRVALLGASETFGLFESEGREYPARVQAILDSIQPGRFDVMNVALPGMGLAAMVPYYQHHVAPFGPQMVFLYPSPSFYLEAATPVEVYSPPAFRASDEAASGNGGFQFRLAGKAKEVVKGLLPESMVAALRARSLQRTRSMHPADWVWESVPAERMTILEHHLDRLIEAIQGSGATVALVTHTNRFVGVSAATREKYRNHLTNLISLYYPRASEHVMVAVDSAANDVVRRVARAHRASVVEAEGKIPAEQFGDYAHFTDAGADAMAHFIATAILQQAPAKP